MKALGFSSTEYVYQQEKNMNAKGISINLNKQRTKLYKRFANAFRMTDPQAMDAALKDIQKFNAKYPTWPITRDDIMKSLKSQVKMASEKDGGVWIPPKHFPMLAN